MEEKCFNLNDIECSKVVSFSDSNVFADMLGLGPRAYIKIKYLPDATRMEMNDRGNWIDCYAYEDVTLKKGEYGYVNLGFACELPEGYEAHIVPRSSTFKHFGVIQTNSQGVIDTSFAGDSDIWMMPVYAMRDTVIKAGERPCQFRIVESQPEITFVECETLGNEARDGFGSSGR